MSINDATPEEWDTAVGKLYHPQDQHPIKKQVGGDHYNRYAIRPNTPNTCLLYTSDAADE